MNDFMRHAKKLSTRVLAFQASIVLRIVYVVCVPLLWVIYRKKTQSIDGWSPWSIKSDTLDDVSRQ